MSFLKNLYGRGDIGGKNITIMHWIDGLLLKILFVSKEKLHLDVDVKKSSFLIQVGHGDVRTLIVRLILRHHLLCV